MSNSLEEPIEDDTSDSVPHLREDNESVRLVVVTHEASSQPETVSQSEEMQSRNLMWWFKALCLCALTLLLTLVFAKWGVPFVFQKVIPLPLILKLQERLFPCLLLNTVCFDYRFLFRSYNGKQLHSAVLCSSLSSFFP